MPIRILVVDEQSIYRAGLCELIAAEMPDVEAREVSKLTQIVSCGHCNTMFDLVLVGAGVSNSAALDTLKTAREARVAIRFAIVSAADTRADILAGLAAGLHGYICKKQSDVEILEAISDILAGRIYAAWSLAVAEAGSELGRGEKIREPVLSTDEVFRLTKRQREVLALLARVKSNKEIARLLHIAEATTKIHMAALLRALGVRNRTEAAFKAASLVDILEPAFREPLTLNDPARERMHQLAEAN